MCPASPCFPLDRRAGGKYRGYGAAGSDDDEDCLDGSPLALSPRRDRSSSGGASGDATPAAGGAAPAADDADADAAAGAADPAPPLHIAGAEAATPLIHSRPFTANHEPGLSESLRQQSVGPTGRRSSFQAGMPHMMAPLLHSSCRII